MGVAGILQRRGCHYKSSTHSGPASTTPTSSISSSSGHSSCSSSHSAVAATAGTSSCQSASLPPSQHGRSSMTSSPHPASRTSLTSLFLLLASVILLSTQPTTALQDVQLDFQHSLWYNPSVVHFEGGFISAVKHTIVHKDPDGKVWWNNTVHMCNSHRITDAPTWTCNVFKPWGQNDYVECLWEKWEMETVGLGDTKLWHWPGKGVYAIFGRKPARRDSGPLCWSLISYNMHLALVKPDPGLVPGSEWDLKQPLKLALDAKHYKKGAMNIKEKNWMPFSYWDRTIPEAPKERVMVVYSVQPHKIHELKPNGKVVPRHSTTSNLFDNLKSGMHIHGGPPVIYVPAGLTSPDSPPFYLGVLHTIQMLKAERTGFDTMGGKMKMYRHFAYRFSAEPPFAIEAVSDELPLVFTNDTGRPHAAFISFVVGFHLTLPHHLVLNNSDGQPVNTNTAVAKARSSRRLLQLPQQQQGDAVLEQEQQQLSLGSGVSSVGSAAAAGSRSLQQEIAEGLEGGSGSTAASRNLEQQDAAAAGSGSSSSGGNSSADVVVDASGHDRKHGIIHISYGSADTHPRVLTMTLPDLMALFTGRMEMRKEHYGAPLPLER